VAGRRWRRSESAPRAKHFLGSVSLAEEIARTADLSPDDLVVELGAGYGRLTESLARRAGRVIAVEIDPRLASRLGHRFRTRPRIAVVSGDLLQMALPKEPFKVVSNLPFSLTSALLHRLLDDPELPLLRADLVVAWGAALALTGVFGQAHKARPWASRYEFLLIRRLPAALFEPTPSADAALISIRPRTR
jgi:23S rRNA (adenine-N6)-dimethyltransferase